MRTRRSALLPIIAAALVAIAAGSAQGERFSSPGGGRHHGGERGGWHNGWHGTVMAVPHRGRRWSGQPAMRRRATQRLPNGARPADEHRPLPDEVLVEVANSRGPRQIDALQRRHRLTRLEQRRMRLSGTMLLRFRIPGGRPLAGVLRTLERDAAVIAAQPNYVFRLQ